MGSERTSTDRRQSLTGVKPLKKGSHYSSRGAEETDKGVCVAVQAAHNLCLQRK